MRISLSVATYQTDYDANIELLNDYFVRRYDAGEGSRCSGGEIPDERSLGLCYLQP